MTDEANQVLNCSAAAVWIKSLVIVNTANSGKERINNQNYNDSALLWNNGTRQPQYSMDQRCNEREQFM